MDYRIIHIIFQLLQQIMAVNFWSGQLNITEYEISLNDLYIYSNYQSGTTHTNQNLRFNVNTIRPTISDISFNKDKLTYLEPSGVLTITFNDDIDVLDESINNYITMDTSFVTINSLYRYNNIWSGEVNINTDDKEGKFNISTNFYNKLENVSLSVDFFSILPKIDEMKIERKTFTYLNLSQDISIKFKNIVFDDMKTLIQNNFIFNGFPTNSGDFDISGIEKLNTSTGTTLNCIFNFGYGIPLLTNIDLNFEYNSSYFDVSYNNQISGSEITSIDTRIPNITNKTGISNTNLTYDASSTQLDVYFDASLLDISASSILDASLVTSFDSDPSINISSFVEINKRHYKANITSEYGIDKSIDHVTVYYMDASAQLNLNVDTILRPYSNICFPKGEKVLTDNGYKNIEQIDIKLDTIRGKKIEELTQTQTQEKTMVLIKCGALMKNMPCKDTLITNNHKVLYKGKLVEAYKLVTLVRTGVEWVDYLGQTLYNVLLEGEYENKMIVNGMVVETLSPSNNISKVISKYLEDYGTNECKKMRND